jgi:hypothetical protein
VAKHDPGHLGQVPVQESRGLLRRQSLGDAGEPGEIGEQERELAAIAREPDLLRMRDDVVDDRGRDVERERATQLAAPRLLREPSPPRRRQAATRARG